MNTSMTDGNKPRWFDAVGWSWMIMGILGALFGLLSLPGLAQLDRVQAMLAAQGLTAFPEVAVVFERLFKLITPITVGQLVYSILLVAAAWLFLNRKNAGRVGLAWLNAGFAVMMVGSAAWMWAWFQKIFTVMGFPELVRQGLMANVPLYMGLVIWISTVLMLAPLVWMGWYFLRPDVRDFTIQ